MSQENPGQIDPSTASEGGDAGDTTPLPGADSTGGKRKLKAKGKRRVAARRRAAAQAKEVQAAALEAAVSDAGGGAVVNYPFARPAAMKKRHWGVIASFVAMVLAPLVLTIFYLMTLAEDQYQSTTGFTVRSQEANGTSEILGGLANFTGTANASDSDILYAFIQSQEMVDEVNARVDLRAQFSQHWPSDWVFSIWPDASLEELVWYWQRIVGISYNAGSGLIEIRTVGFRPEVAQEINQAIIDVSQIRINALNEQAREDAMGYARTDLDEALAKLKVAREALTQFRTRTRIVDPEADIQGRMGVMNNLQQQLAEALIEHDLLEGTVSQSDPRIKKLQQRIEVIRARIDAERHTFASDNTDTGAVGEDYPSLISEFESLTVDRQYAEEVYRVALGALEVARDKATRQSRYLATYIKPTLAEEAEYPRRGILTGIVGLFMLLCWTISVLVYYSIRDRN